MRRVLPRPSSRSPCISLMRLLSFMALALFAAISAYKGFAQSSAPLVVEVRVDGIISPASADFIVRGLEQAAKDKAELFVIQLDTPGGLDTSMRTVVRQILASPVPVATFVGPAGARAASAGTFILYASHIAAMTPASNLGAASPVQIGGSPQPAAPATPATAPKAQQGGDEGDTPAKDAKTGTPAAPGDTMMNKVTNDAAAYIRSLAQLRGRNIKFAESAVRDAASMSASEALDAHVVDFVASDLGDLLKQVDGREVKLTTGTTVLHTLDARIQTIEPGWRYQLLALIANPQVALVLLMVGIYGLFYEMLNPGLALPGVAGFICLLLGLYAFQLLPVSWTGVGLLALGISLMVAEAFLPSFGVIGAGGVVAFVLGGLFLTDTGIPEFDLSIPFLVAVALCSVAFLIIVGAVAARAHKHPVVSGREDMLGQEGVVASVGRTAVYASIHGESWRVRCPDSLQEGDQVRVKALDGLTLLVERIKAGP